MVSVKSHYFSLCCSVPLLKGAPPAHHTTHAHTPQFQLLAPFKTPAILAWCFLFSLGWSPDSWEHLRGTLQRFAVAVRGP